MGKSEGQLSEDEILNHIGSIAFYLNIEGMKHLEILASEVKRLQAMESELVKLRAVIDKQHILLDQYGSLLNEIGADTE